MGMGAEFPEHHRSDALGSESETLMFSETHRSDFFSSQNLWELPRTYILQ
ncbi:hypothetical protein G436_0253 [Leptospira interrogans serovar Hardjo str. Norma]|uniref:Uncharacterized protein n=1 Tax=Leptospira interrogans serovar Hardjo str. Norma TaxID=1279460 RepID=A0A0M4MQV4_LEPIR|nr:hypothetical protein G436_0253 [Leptospira interrogans serovar Hardjo str. Norma]